MFTPTGNLGFDAAVRAAELARQNSLRVPGVTQAQARAADITFHTTVIAAGATFGISCFNSMEALVELGVSSAIPPN